MVYCDEQVVTLFLRDRPVRGGGGQVGQEARPLLGSEVSEGVGVARVERARLGPLVGEVGLSDLFGVGVYARFTLLGGVFVLGVNERSGSRDRCACSRDRL